MKQRLYELRLKKGQEKIIMLTAYDYQMAKILDEAGIDLLLVGDSLGMVFQGHLDTKSVTMEHMLYHTRAVAKGAKGTPIIGDMPIYSDKTVEKALENARRFVEAGAHGVKIEGNKSEVVEGLVEAGIPVMGHVGLLPQTAEGYRVKGVFSIVLECMPENLSKRITQAVRAPTIGIGAGKHCDGQVLVINDMLGFNPGFAPKYLKKYVDLHKIIAEGVAKFKVDVSKDIYPDRKHTYH